MAFEISDLCRSAGITIQNIKCLDILIVVY